MIEPWFDLCRKPYESREAARADMDRVVPLLKKTSEGILLRKLAKGFRQLTPLTFDVTLVEPVESRLAPIGKFYIELRASTTVEAT